MMKIRPFVVIAVAICAPSFFPVCAQDVVVGEPRWFLPEPAPEVLPKATSRLRPDYPDELRKAGEIGYVIITRYLDEKGKSLSLGAVGTQAPFQRAVEAELRGWEMKPAQRGGQPVPALIWLPVIFNPKSATAKGPDATPRLLEVTPVVTKERPTRAGQSPVVRMKLNLDATGVITAAEPEGEVKEAVLAAIREALKTWKFAPARAAGQAVAAEVTVSVLCQRPTPTDLGKKTPPKVIKQVAPEYPMALLRERLRGEVRIDFEVDTTGRVQNAMVLTSNNPAFNEPALAALREWKFQPALQEGKPIKARMQVPVVFALDGGYDAFQVESKSDQSKLPENLRYDTPAKLLGVIVPVYPYALRRDGVSGKAKGVMVIDPRGRVTGVKVVSADKPEFGLALTAALEGFTFDPALRAGKPVMQALAYEETFDEFKLSDRDGSDLLDVERKHPERIVGAGKLDAPLKPISRRGPVAPTSWPKDVEKGEALVEFLVDRDGHVRLPRIVSATADGFGYAAVQAVASWQFEKPLAGGKPAIVRARVPFSFVASAPKPAAEQATGGEKPEAAK